MKAGIRFHDMEARSLEERLALAERKGYRCIHLANFVLYREYGITAAGLTPGLAMYLKELLAKYHLDVAVFGCYLNLANPDPVQLQAIQQEYMDCIRFAAWLGAGVVGTETGAPNTEYRYEEACHSEEALQTFITNFRPVAEYAEKMGVVIAIEPVWRHIVYDENRARTVLDALKSPNVQIIFDPVNMLAPENEQRQDELISHTFETIGKEIMVVHAKDFCMENGQLLSGPAGTGCLNYSLIMKYLKANKPYIHVTMEDTTPDTAGAAFEYLHKMWMEA